ncbi:MAG: Maf family protein [Methylacidiphilales bacterium]|nr:Maf family protein [Candidatus Methylacidiphilales bacterium]
MSRTEIILASASPRRRELLRQLGVPFEVVTADVRELDEDSSSLSPADLACENARLKAEAVAKLRPDRWVLGADTVVALEQKLLGKPDSLDQAHDFLWVLSRKKHQVITGCALISPENETVLFHEISSVVFKPLTEEIITDYLRQVHVLDKAGGYALQEQGDLIIECVEGSSSNVIGLPVELLEKIFKARGLL